MGDTLGRLVYAVGDVHGCSDLLADLLVALRADAREDAARGKPILVFLGDYVDRGPDSPGVIDRLIAQQASEWAETVCLAGNHERAMLEFLDDSRLGPQWGSFGGRATLEAYRAEPPRFESDLAGWEAARERLNEHLPPAHRAFLEALPNRYSWGGYFFAHAGVAPDVDLERQSEDDLLWIREEFLDDPRPLAKIVVHGHTPSCQPHSDERRIGIDTGAYATGVLTAVRLVDDHRRFIEAAGMPGLLQTVRTF